MREALEVATSTNKKEVEVLSHVAEGGLGVLIDNPTVWTEGQLPAPPTNANRLPHQSLMLWKFVKRNSLSVPTQNSGGTTAVKLGGPVFTKVDRAAGRCFSRPSGVYKGTQSATAVNWSG